MELKARYLMSKILIRQFFRNSIFKFKRLFYKQPKWESANIIEYPDCYLIITLHSLKNGPSIHSEEITKLNVDAKFSLSQYVLSHLDKSEHGIGWDKKFNSKDIIAKLTGRKSIKSQMSESKMISVSRNKKIIRISSTKNGGHKGPNRGYIYHKDPIILELPIKEEDLSVALFSALEKSD